MAYTLAEYERLAADPLRRGVINIFRRESIIMDLLQWEDSKTLTIQIIRTKSLPTVSFRPIGGPWAESKGQVEPISERVFDMGGYTDVDKLLVRAESVVDQRALQTDMWTTALAYMFQDYFINGNPTVDENAFSGLFWRIVKSGSYPTTQEINLAGLDISPDAAGLSANLDTFLDNVQKLQHRTDGHRCDLFICNETTYLRWCSALRQKGLYATTKDSFGRTIVTWGEGGPKIIDAGCKADQATNIITDVELTNGTALTGGTATSIYAVKLGDKFLKGFQLYSLEVDDIGKLESGIAFRTVIDWPLGIYTVSPRSIARLSGLVAA